MKKPSIDEIRNGDDDWWENSKFTEQEIQYMKDDTQENRSARFFAGVQWALDWVEAQQGKAGLELKEPTVKTCGFCGGVFFLNHTEYLECHKCHKQIVPEAYHEPIKQSPIATYESRLVELKRDVEFTIEHGNSVSLRDLIMLDMADRVAKLEAGR